MPQMLKRVGTGHFVPWEEVVAGNQYANRGAQSRRQQLRASQRFGTVS